MKLITSLSIIFIAFVLMASGCKKNSNSNNSPVDQLPPATQTGANTFGCLINGQAFTPGVVLGQGLI
jgi:hypothetical protein